MKSCTGAGIVQHPLMRTYMHDADTSHRAEHMFYFRHACKPFELHVSRSLSMCQPHVNITIPPLWQPWQRWVLRGGKHCSTNSNTVNNHKSTTTTPPFQHDSTVGACDAARPPCDFVCSMLAAMCGLATMLSAVPLVGCPVLMRSPPGEQIVATVQWQVWREGHSNIHSKIIEKKGDVCLRFYAQTEQQHSTATELQLCCFAFASVQLSRHSSCGLANRRSPPQCTAVVHGNNMLSGNIMA